MVFLTEKKGESRIFYHPKNRNFPHFKKAGDFIARAIAIKAFFIGALN